MLCFILAYKPLPAYMPVGCQLLTRHTWSATVPKKSLKTFHHAERQLSLLLHYSIVAAVDYDEAEYPLSTRKAPANINFSGHSAASWYHWRPCSQREFSNRREDIPESVQSGPPSRLTVQDQPINQQSSTPNFSRNAGLVYLETSLPLHLNYRTIHLSLQDQ